MTSLFHNSDSFNAESFAAWKAEGSFEKPPQKCVNCGEMTRSWIRPEGKEGDYCIACYREVWKERWANKAESFPVIEISPLDIHMANGEELYYLVHDGEMDFYAGPYSGRIYVRDREWWSDGDTPAVSLTVAGYSEDYYQHDYNIEELIEFINAENPEFTLSLNPVSHSKTLAAERRPEKEVPAEVRVIQNRGFQISFKNGYGLSVMFGAGNYGEHRNADPVEFQDYRSLGSSTAEIAIYTHRGEVIADLLPLSSSPGDTVLGWVTPEDITKILAAVATGNELKMKKVVKAIRAEQKAESFPASRPLRWMRLQGVGKVPAIRADALKVGDWIGWNMGYGSEVLAIKPRGRKSLVITVRNKKGENHDILKRKDTLVYRIPPRMVKHWKAEEFNAYGFGEIEGPSIFGPYSLRDLLESIAGPQGRLSFDEASAWDYRAETKGEPSYSQTVKSGMGVAMADERESMKNVAILVGAVLVGYHWDNIWSRIKSVFGGFASESGIALSEIAEDSEYSIGEVDFQGGEGGLAANEQSPAPVKFDYTPVAGPTQMTHDPSTRPHDAFN